MNTVLGFERQTIAAGETARLTVFHPLRPFTLLHLYIPERHTAALEIAQMTAGVLDVLSSDSKPMRADVFLGEMMLERRIRADLTTRTVQREGDVFVCSSCRGTGKEMFEVEHGRGCQLSPALKEFAGFDLEPGEPITLVVTNVSEADLHLSAGVVGILGSAEIGSVR